MVCNDFSWCFQVCFCLVAVAKRGNVSGKNEVISFLKNLKFVHKSVDFTDKFVYKSVMNSFKFVCKSVFDSEKFVHKNVVKCLNFGGKSVSLQL